jgi:hypothetical protein
MSTSCGGAAGGAEPDAEATGSASALEDAAATGGALGDAADALALAARPAGTTSIDEGGGASLAAGDESGSVSRWQAPGDSDRSRTPASSESGRGRGEGKAGVSGWN